MGNFTIQNDKWFTVWTKEKYAEGKKHSFDVMDTYLQSVGHTPKRILDIGCGRAFESQWLQEKYGCELYLLDGDYEDRPSGASRDASWGEAASMSFYNPVSKLKEDWDSRGLDYTFVDANNINIDHNIKFDLVYSFLSCGFHYPLSTYSKLIKKHTDADSNIIIDLRGKRSVSEQQKHDYELIREIDRGKKHRRSLINLL